MERLAYSVKEAATLIGVSGRTISREIQRGRLAVVRVGRRVLIPADALAAFAGCATNSNGDAIAERGTARP
jgi:excisionase family DNA binding protein